MGIKAQSLDPIHALHGDLGMVTNQVIIFISRSGTTEELINLAKVLQGLKRNNIKSPITVGFFLNNKLPYKDLFDHLIVPSKKFPPEKIYEFDSKNLVPSLSINILQLLLDDFGIEILSQNLILLKVTNIIIWVEPMERNLVLTNFLKNSKDEFSKKFSYFSRRKEYSFQRDEYLSKNIITI